MHSRRGESGASGASFGDFGASFASGDFLRVPVGEVDGIVAAKSRTLYLR